jgi:hypothetical protein
VRAWDNNQLRSALLDSDSFTADVFPSFLTTTSSRRRFGARAWRERVPHAGKRNFHMAQFPAGTAIAPHEVNGSNLLGAAHVDVVLAASLAVAGLEAGSRTERVMRRNAIHHVQIVPQ